MSSLPLSKSQQSGTINQKRFQKTLAKFIWLQWFNIDGTSIPDLHRKGARFPAQIKFAKNPLVEFRQDRKELGKLHKKNEDVFGLDVRYFEGTVDFVRTIQLKIKIKTNLSGTIE